MYIHKLAEKVKKCNNIYHSTIKFKPIDVKSSRYIYTFSEKNNDKDPKFKVDNHMKISKHKNIFGKRCALSLTEEVFVTKKVKKYNSVDICC